MTSSLASLPDRLRAEVLNPPPSGTGLHNWIFKMALKLHAHLQPSEIYAVLRRVTMNRGRDVPDREINDAIRNSAGILKRATGSSEGGAFGNSTLFRSPAPAWPACDPVLQRSAAMAVAESIPDFLSSSPGQRIKDAEYYADALMGDCLLCCGTSTGEFETKHRSAWRGSLNDQQFIVPSPMSSVWGQTRDGQKQSMHTLSNTGPRWFVVVEFDGIDLNLQFSLHQHLAMKAHLVLLVHSGGKSLHGWYYCQGRPEEKVRAFFEYAVRLGADSRTWSRSQFVRMPGGIRRNCDGTSTSQPVFYFNPNVPRTPVR